MIVFRLGALQRGTKPIEWMANDLQFLALGSTFILIVAILGYPYLPALRPLASTNFALFFGLTILAIFGLTFHALAWMFTLVRVWPSTQPSYEDDVRGIRRAFFIGTAAFVLAIALLPIHNLWGLEGVGIPGFYFLVAISPLVAYLPLLPFVFGPVALSHAYTFHLLARSAPSGGSAKFIRIAAY